MNALKCIVVGFIAGAIAAVTVQEFVSWLFLNYWAGWHDVVWSTEPYRSVVAPDVVLPRVANTAIVGGLWGALFGLVLGWKPEGMMTIRGAILGLVGPGLIAAFYVLPNLTGQPSPLAEGDVSQIVPILCITAAFGAVAAWLYGFFAYLRLP